MKTDANPPDGPGPKTSPPAASRRFEATMHAAASRGLVQGKKELRLSFRANERLVRAAQETSGLEGSSLVEYALAKVALEDEFARTLLALRGTVSPDADLEF